jgi:hypothetical protein
MSTAEEIAERIQEQFPTLNLKVNSNDPNVDWSILIPPQDGLKFECNLNRQGDELHLSILGFWLEWFPLEDEDVAEAYFDAVVGILSGRYRIVEYVRFGRGVGGELQAPVGTSWKTIGNSSTGILPRGWLSRTRVIQNA